MDGKVLLISSLAYQLASNGPCIPSLKLRTLRGIRVYMEYFPGPCNRLHISFMLEHMHSLGWTPYTPTTTEIPALRILLSLLTNYSAPSQEQCKLTRLCF